MDRLKVIKHSWLVTQDFMLHSTHEILLKLTWRDRSILVDTMGHPKIVPSYCPKKQKKDHWTVNPSLSQ